MRPAPIFSGVAKIKSSFARLPKPPKWTIVTAGVILGLAAGCVVIFPPAKSLEYTYASKSACISSFVPLPGMQKTQSDDFSVSVAEAVTVGKIQLVATKLCVEPKVSPKEGVATVRMSPFGNWFSSQRFHITVAKPPVANRAELAGRKVSTARPLSIALSSQDALHAYTLHLEDRAVGCESKEGLVSCNVPKLDLDQGREYSAELKREYKAVSATVVSGEITTLQPVKLVESSIVAGDTVYGKPTGAHITFDQELESSKVTLVKSVGDDSAEVPLKVGTAGAVLSVEFGELEREAAYELKLDEALAKSGSSLADPIVIPFKTSGGPAVKSVSVGANMVPRSSKIIITFDQPLAKGVELSRFIKVEGIAASIARQGDDQASVSINGAACQAFTIVLEKGLGSAVNDGVSKEGWRHASRTICGSSWSIGTSLKGRPIMAHSFGSGSTTLLFTGSIHGSEASAYATLQAWVAMLQTQPVPADKRVVIVPLVNPDGYAAGTRYNSRDVNLGRNFPTANWSASIETASGVLPAGGGSAPLSEPEAAALAQLTRQLMPRLEVSFHAQGRLVGANKFSDSVAIGTTYAKTVGYTTMFYNAEAVMGYSMTGEYEDWMGEALGIPAILIELPSHSGNYLNSQLPALQKLLSL